jgi:hypothetical protein
MHKIDGLVYLARLAVVRDADGADRGYVVDQEDVTSAQLAVENLIIKINQLNLILKRSCK